MKALVITDKEQPLVLKEVPDPVPGVDEAIVQIHAAALNHRDLWIQKGQYAGLKYPITPGSDGAGIVTATGNKTDAHWIGKEVIIDPALHWGDSETHQHPKDFKIVGLPDDGTCAEYVKVPASSLVAKPPHLSFTEAAVLPLAGVTAYRALIKRAQLQANEKVLITGIGGGVALFGLQYAVATGATIFVTSGNEEKINKAIALGAKAGVNYRQENWVSTLQQQAGSFDVIMDGAAGNGVNDLLALAKPGGRIVFYGATQGNASNIEIRRIFWKQLNVLGSTMGSPADFAAMIHFVNSRQLKPTIDKVFAFADGDAAFKRMDEAQQFGKIVIQVVGSSK